MARPPDVTSGFVPMAHRGGALLPGNVGIENTTRAFRNAVDIGYRHLETDVHATADGALVAFHDADLARVTGEAGRIADMTLDEVRSIPVGGQERIPTMDELLEGFPGCFFNIDLKAPGAVPLLALTLTAHGALRRVCVGSFSRQRLIGFRTLLPEVMTAASTPEVMAMRAGVVRRRRLPGEVVYQVPLAHTVGGITVPLVTPRTVRSVHAAGRRMHVWTIDDAATMQRLIDWGVDGIVTDRPDVLKAVLLERGMWSTREGT